MKLVNAKTLAAMLLCAARLSNAADLNAQVLSTAEAYRGEALQLLERLVNIDSGTGNETGLRQVGVIVADELRSAGAHVDLVSAAPAVGDNILATWKGTGKVRILLMAHMDTVFKDGTARASPFRIRDKRAYGPGVMDDKGGMVAGLYAMKILQKLDFRQYKQVTLLLNTNEETGSKGTRALIEREALQHDFTLNLEPGRPADGLVVWRKGSGTVEIDVKGKAAHAGVAPESGRNAAVELAHQVLQLGQLGDSAKQTTVNFTVLQAGGAINVIPDHATAFADVRVAVPEEFDRVERDLARVSRDKLILDTEVDVKLVRGLPPMPRTTATDDLATKAQTIYSEIGRKLTLEGSGGAADASVSAGVGTPTLDGFGIVGGGIHTPDEYAEVESVVPRLYLLSRMVMELAVSK
jgi:glutamate carboxypeptidase